MSHKIPLDDGVLKDLFYRSFSIKEAAAHLGVGYTLIQRNWTRLGLSRPRGRNLHPQARRIKANAARKAAQGN